ncbi:hypothetical protein [Oceanospirillum beijerinckii]|uniref:hypothetical protein n=1 Tax=Oceanospirillum beijerinckii TaxID=64976 RepID=UPI0004137AF0|nr:hypothetical protein [Oceanospirillum beijerinckii]
MNMSEMGEVYAYLLRYRMAESRPSQRNRRASRAGLISERDVCAILAQASEDEISQLRQFLNGQGLQLVFIEASDYPGISAGGRMYLLQRLPESDLPALFSQQPVYASMRLRQESQEEIALWFLHLWLLLMGLLYTRNNRSLTDVSQYQEAVFSVQELITAMRQHLEQLRQSGIQGTQVSPAVRALIDEKGEDIPRRVRVFIELMEQAGHLQRNQDKSDSDDVAASSQQASALQTSYQQTLLGALEAEQIGLHHLHHLLNDLNLPEAGEKTDAKHTTQTDTSETEATAVDWASDKISTEQDTVENSASEEESSEERPSKQTDMIPQGGDLLSPIEDDLLSQVKDDLLTSLDNEHDNKQASEHANEQVNESAILDQQENH